MPLRIALLLPCTLACSSNPAHAPVTEPATFAHTRPAASAKATHTRAAWFERAQSFTPSSDTPFRSQHFDGRSFAAIRVDSEADALYRALVADTRFSEGTLIVEALSRDAGSAPVTFLALTLTHDGWRFFAADASGQPEPLDDGTCRGCHAGAPAAPVFGPARRIPARESKR